LVDQSVALFARTDELIKDIIGAASHEETNGLAKGIE
jgi:hypothetical protein